MQKWGARETIGCIVAVLLGMSICYYVGKRQGRMDEKLSSNKTQIVSQDSVAKLVTSVVDSAKKHDAALDSTHDVIRSRIKVVHDTILVTQSGNDSTQTRYVSPDIASLIVADDSLIAAQKRSLALQDTLIASLRKSVELRDTRIHLLESKGTSRFSRGLQVGLGYCATVTGNTPCAYAGYGISLRIP